MNDHGDHRPYEDDLAAYLLDALTADEARVMEQHLEGCERCRERARWLRGSVELLPTAVEQLEPPPRLKEQLMRTVRAETETEPAAEPDRRDARPGPRWLGRMLALPRPAVALGAALLLAGAGLLGYAVGNEGGEGQTATVQAQVAPPGARVVLVRDGDRGILRVTGLPQHKDRIYEVWLAEGRRVRPSGLFQVDRRGRGAAAIPHGLNDADAVMVSLEPPGGSARPTTDPVVVTQI